LAVALKKFWLKALNAIVPEKLPYISLGTYADCHAKIWGLFSGMSAAL
jgi:hypothetical protein